jgi:hypothetical protein
MVPMGRWSSASAPLDVRRPAISRTRSQSILAWFSNKAPQDTERASSCSKTRSSAPQLQKGGCASRIHRFGTPLRLIAAQSETSAAEEI